jgi:hypothetical protein
MLINTLFWTRSQNSYSWSWNKWLKPRVILGFNKAESLGKLAVQMSKDSGTEPAQGSYKTKPTLSATEPH